LAWRPEPVLIIQIMLLTTVQALVMVTGAVVVSSQVTSTRAANLLASFIVIPMALVIQGESVIMFIAPDTASSRGIGALWAIIAGMVIVCLLLLRVGSSIFNREELLSSTVDQLNLRGSLRKIWRYVRAVDAEGTPAKNLGDWYRRAIPFSLSRIKTAVLVSIAVFLLAFVIGVVVGNMPRWQLPLENHGEIVTSPDDFDNFISANFQSREAVLFIFSQNVRVLIGTTLLAMFTFGAFALIIPPLTFAVMGYLFTQVIAAGFNPWILAAAIIPHGIIEIPMVLLATAAALALGASVTSPVRSRQSGQGWLARLGDTIKLFFGIVIPGLVIAAVIEAFITPEILLRVLT
jgi:uncharacterized membrane protein SpoIIM required for sporulation